MMAIEEELYVKLKMKERERELLQRARLREAEAARRLRHRRIIGVRFRPPRWAARRPERRAA